MKLLVGLGNPGARYAGSRHNIGFEIAVAFARAHGIVLDEERFHGRYGAGSLAAAAVGAAGEPPGAPTSSARVGLLLPGTFMNDSGRAVAAAVDELGIDPEHDLLVAYDDLDLQPGRLRLRPGGGPGGHNGVASIIAELGSKRFARLRFGIGRPPAGADIVPFVLARFSPEEQSALPAQLERAASAAESAFRDGVVVAMDLYNRDPAPLLETGPAALETGLAASETGPAASETGPAASETEPAASRAIEGAAEGEPSIVPARMPWWRRVFAGLSR